MRIKITLIVLVFFITAGHPIAARAQGDYEFYLFGVNIKSFRNCNWLQVAAGAATSLLVHELGHALYMEAQGKKWDFEVSGSSGMAITFTDSLSPRQYRDFGRAGFALQTGIGLLLASMPATRGRDFTKGWVGVNSVQLYTYQVRTHEHGNDLSMIEKGGGNTDLEMGMLAMVSSYNLLQTQDTNGGLWGKSGGVAYRRQATARDTIYTGVFDTQKINRDF